jgi:hypothetical protein
VVFLGIVTGDARVHVVDVVVLDAHGEIGDRGGNLDEGTAQDAAFALGPFFVFDDVAWIVGMLVEKQEKIEYPRDIRGHEKGFQNAMLE